MSRLNRRFVESLESRTLLSITPTPFRGTPALIPGVVQAENFDNGGEGVAYHDLTPANLGASYRTTGVDVENMAGGGHDVGYTQAGEWLIYTVNVKTAGAYRLSTRVASQGAGGQFHVEFDGVNRSGTLIIPNTGVWNTWTDIDANGIALSAGKHLMRIVFDADGPGGFVGNLDSLTLVAANPGQADATFGNGGSATAGFGSAVGVSGLAVQTDGKILVVGSDHLNGFSAGDFVLARLLPNGALDPTFGSGGKVVTDLGNIENAPRLAILPDGKLLLAGVSADDAGFGGFALARYLPDGRLDTAFGNKGKVIQSRFDAQVAQVALQTDGKIVLVGSDNGVFIDVARFNADGSWDTGFATGGLLATNLGYDAVGGCLAIQPDGKILVGATTFPGRFGATPDRQAVVFRLNPNGTSDTSFAAQGVVHGLRGSTLVTALTPDGKVIIGGIHYTSSANTGHPFLARYTAGGAPDTSFGKSGVAELSGGGAFVSIAVQNDGRIVAGTDGGKLVRFAAAGALDSDFGSAGIAARPVSTAIAEVALAPNGDIITAGQNASRFVVNRHAGDAPRPAPFLTRAFAAGAVIQGEDFDSGGDGIGYHDTTFWNEAGQYRYGGVDIERSSDTGGGHDICFTRAGEWLRYGLNVATGGDYAIDLRVASPLAGAKFHVEVDGHDVSGPITMPNTGGWQNWRTITTRSTQIAAGRHALRLALDSAAGNGFVGNFSWLRLRAG